MFKLSRLTDYAILILSSFVAESHDPVSAKVIAAQTGLPIATIRKVLRLLSKQGLVIAQQGAQGGYVLAKPQSAISLHAVIEAMEGMPSLASCLDHQHCLSQERCRLQNSWQTLHYWLVQLTQQVSIRDMVQGCQHHTLHPFFQTLTPIRLNSL